MSSSLINNPFIMRLFCLSFSSLGNVCFLSSIGNCVHWVRENNGAPSILLPAIRDLSLVLCCWPPLFLKASGFIYVSGHRNQELHLVLIVSFSMIYSSLSVPKMVCIKIKVITHSIFLAYSFFLLCVKGGWRWCAFVCSWSWLQTVRSRNFFPPYLLDSPYFFPLLFSEPLVPGPLCH